MAKPFDGCYTPIHKPVGRIAAFIDYEIARNNEQPTGGVGFFECINSPEAATQLFDTAKEWLQQRGMEALDGPINFGDRDRWWGLLVEATTHQLLHGLPSSLLPRAF